MSREDASLIEQEVKAMLEKGAVQKAIEMKGQFLSNLFQVSKKGGGNRPVINLKNMNSIIQYLHYKMEGLHLLKDLLKEKDFMCKIDLKDAISVFPFGTLLYPERSRLLLNIFQEG